MGSTPRVLSQVGVALLVLYIVILLASLWPIQLIVPAFQLRLGSQLISSGPIALVGLALVRLGSSLDPGDQWIKNLERRAAALAVVAVLGFLLLVPLLSVASVRQQQSQVLARSQELRRAEAQLQAFRQALDSSSTPTELEQRFRDLQGPRFDAVDRSLPMSQLRARTAALLDQLASQLETRRRQLPSLDLWQKLPEILRTTLGSVALAGGFAALARRPDQEVSLLDEPLLAWSFWQYRRRQFRASTKSGRRRSALPEQDYISQLSGQQEDEAREL